MTITASSPFPRSSIEFVGVVEAAASPADVVFLRVSAPVIVVRGAATSAAVFCEGGSAVDVSGEQEQRGLEDSSDFLRGIGRIASPELVAERFKRFPRDLQIVVFFVDFDAEREQYLR